MPGRHCNPDMPDTLSAADLNAPLVVVWFRALVAAPETGAFRVVERTDTLTRAQAEALYRQLGRALQHP